MVGLAKRDSERAPWRKKIERLQAPLRDGLCPDFERDMQASTVLELIMMKIRHPPDAYKPGVLRGTRKQTQWDIKLLSTAHELENVVYVPHMLEQLFAPIEHLLADIKLDYTKPAHVPVFAARVHPYITLHGLPPVTNSEQDTQEEVHRVLVRPALAVLDVVRRWLLSNKQCDPI